MSMIDIPIAHIRRQAKPRPLNQTAIRSIAESFQSTGQISPIVVKKDHPMIGVPEDRYMLISGNHRLSAAESLGWATIKASVVDKETHPIHLELIEVDENLCRAELTPAEKAMAVKKRKILWDSLREQQGNSGTQSSTIRGPGMPQGFATSTAAAIGMSKQKVNDYLRIADQFPGCQVFFDVSSPYGVKVDNKMVIQRSGLDEKSFLVWGLESTDVFAAWD